MNDIITTHSEETRDFVDTVRERAGLGTYAEGYELIQAVLTVLGKSISGGQANHLAEWLPEDLSGEIAGQSGQASAFDKTAFLDNVGGRIAADDSAEVERQTVAVFQAIRSAAPIEEREATMAQLPPPLAEMLK